MLKQPPLQTATATIDNYCARLQSATLLEDRRAAIEGLRSVAKQYPASVASGSLRELILILRRDGVGEQDGGDVDTIRLVLETLLRLFEPEPDSPEAGDEIAYFLADEFCMRQENISLLLNLLDPTAPYSDNLSCKLSVQILSAICAARPERLQESILGAPLGVSRLVGVLDNARDDVRYAGLELLTNLTGGANEELRKIVAFDDVFARVFALIRLEGGLAEARIVVQDCLTLMINLVKGSASNQAMFRESGCVGQLADVLKEVLPSSEPEAPFITENRIRGGWGVLQLLRQLLIPGEPATPQNQAAFFRVGVAQLLVDLAFHPDIPPMVRGMALWSIADLIRNNAPIQVNFASILLRGNASIVSGDKASGTYIIEALLGLVLQQQRAQRELRVAGCAVIQAYLVGHLEIRAHFLQRAIAGHKEREQAPNVLSALLLANGDNLSVVLSGWTVQDLVAQNRDAKAAFAAVSEGETSEGEDLLTSITTLALQLQQSIEQKAEIALIAAYATTLCVLLWDFADGINDLLAEGSSVLQTLVEGVKSGSPVTAGLTASLLGIVYEFSTKDSPIPRKTLASLLVQKLGRDKYLTALAGLRNDPSVRDYDLPVETSERLELSESFFNLFLNEYPRLRRAIDKDPGIEVLPYAAAEAGVQRDILDELRNQITNVEASLVQSQQAAALSSKQAQQEGAKKEQRIVVAEQEKTKLERERKLAVAETERIRSVIAKMQTSHENDVRRLQSQRAQDLEESNIKHSRELAATRQEADLKAQQARQAAEQGLVPVRQDFERRLAEVREVCRVEQSGHVNTKAQLEQLLLKQSRNEEEINTANRRASLAEEEIHTANQRVDAAEEEIHTAKQRVVAAEEEASIAKQRAGTAEHRVEDLQNQLDAAHSTADNLQKQLDAAHSTADNLQKQHDAAQSTTNNLQKELDALQRKYTNLEEELTEAKTNTTAKPNKKDAEAAKKADKLKQLSSSLADEIKALKASAEKSKIHEAELKMIQSAKEAELKKIHSDKEAELKKIHSAKDAEFKKKQDARDVDFERIQTAKDAEYHKMQSTKDAESQKTIQQARDAEKSAKEELENLLLVLGEIESKRDEYKAKVKDLGGEVSDADEDEDDSEVDEEGHESEVESNDDVD